MGASLNEIKQRITSTKKTSQITRAMQMVSASKLTKSEAHSSQFQIYAKKVRELVTHITTSQLIEMEKSEKKQELDFNSMLVSRPVKKTGYIVITSDGGFFKARYIPLAYELRNLSDQPSFEEVRKIVNMTVSMYQNEVFDELYVCYNHHVNSLTSQFRMEKMLPITTINPEEAKTYEQEYIFEPSKEAILNQLLPQYAESLIYGAIVDAKTAEHAAGMTAMKTATDNAGNIIDDLTISYNRARQGAITQEITEIVGGAAALE
jgi:F-type H+-transporting ATPase subunit gamma